MILDRIPPARAYMALERKLNDSSWFKGLGLLAVRLYIAKFFFLSGLTKIGDFHKTIALFTDEYKVPVLPPEIAAYMSAMAELSLPVLLCLGLFTRFAGLGLFSMTLVIAIFVYPDEVENEYILLLCAVLVSQGGGVFCLDRLWSKRF